MVKPEEIFRTYEEYAKTLRTWFVAYGIGGPVLFLTNDSVREAFTTTELGKRIGMTFLLGVGIQVVLAFLNKAANLSGYFAAIQPERNSRRSSRLWAKFGEQDWVDFVADFVTIALFGWATWAAFNLVVRVP